MMKSRRGSVASNCRQKASTLGRVAQVEPEDLKPMAPLVEIGFPRIALRGIARKARGDDQLRARSAAASVRPDSRS